MTKITRNPQETQQKILESALLEFTANGYHGARVDSIVKNAGISKRMVYHYFDDKAGLFKALIQSELDCIQQVADNEPNHDFFAIADHWLKNIAQTKNFFKLLLSSDSLAEESGITLQQQQQQGFDISRQVYADLLKKNGLENEVDPAYFLLAMVSLTTMPILLPQLSKTITGEEPDSATFQKEYQRVLRMLFPAMPE